MKQLLLTCISLLFGVCVSNAQTTFQKTFGGLNWEADYGTSVQQTADGGYIIAGYTESFGSGLKDVYLTRTDSEGDILWTKAYGGSGDDYGNSVQQTADGGFIIAGYTMSFGAGLNDVYLIRTDANGDLLWSKTIGGSDEDYGYNVVQTSDGGFIITGETWSFGAGGSDAYLVRTDSSGSVLWTKTFGGSNDDFGNSIQRTADGGYIITGQTSSFGAGGYDVYLIKTNSTGDTLWTKALGESGLEIGNSIRQTTDDGYIITG